MHQLWTTFGKEEHWINQRRSFSQGAQGEHLPPLACHVDSWAINVLPPVESAWAHVFINADDKNLQQKNVKAPRSVRLVLTAGAKGKHSSSTIEFFWRVTKFLGCQTDGPSGIGFCFAVRGVLCSRHFFFAGAVQKRSNIEVGIDLDVWRGGALRTSFDPSLNSNLFCPIAE